MNEAQVNCSTGCATGGHATYGECLRAKSLKIAYSQSAAGKDATAVKRADAELDRYERAVLNGMQPESTRLKDIVRAEKWSERHGQPYSHEAARDKNTQILQEVATA